MIRIENVDANNLFTSILNHVCKEMKFTLNNKVSLSIFSDEVIKQAFNAIRRKSVMYRTIPYFIGICKGISRRCKVKLNHEQANIIRSHPDVSAMLKAESLKEGNTLNLNNHHPFLGSNMHNDNTIHRGNKYKAIREWLSEEYEQYFLAQFKGELRRACRNNSKSESEFYPKYFKSRFCTPSDIEEASQKQKELDVSAAIFYLTEKATQSIEEYVHKYLLDYRDARRAAFHQTYMTKNDKEVSVLEIATINDVINTRWFSGLHDQFELFTKKHAEGLGRAIILRHQENINSPGE